MARQPNIIRPIKLTLHLPEDLKSRVDLFLWSDVHRRVPYGAYTQLITTLLQEYLEKHERRGTAETD